jgi:hypothetical protein
MAALPKEMYLFRAIPIKILVIFITEKHKRLQLAMTILSKKSNAGGFTILYFKLYYKAIAIKTTWC